MTDTSRRLRPHRDRVRFLKTLVRALEEGAPGASASSRNELMTRLRQALAEVRILSGILRICAACKHIHDDDGSWKQLEVYIRDHSEAEFSHGLCPACAENVARG